MLQVDYGSNVLFWITSYWRPFRKSSTIFSNFIVIYHPISQGDVNF